jgi:hypothetical protein
MSLCTTLATAMLSTGMGYQLNYDYSHNMARPGHRDTSIARIIRLHPDWRVCYLAENLARQVIHVSRLTCPPQ